MTLPLIAVVGRVNFQNSVSDMVVYGVTTDYLKQSAIQPVEGGIFASDEISNKVSVSKNEGEVAGVMNDVLESAEFGKEIGKVNYDIFPDEWIRVRSGPQTNAKIIGYTRRMQDSGEGTEIWGDKFVSDDTSSDSSASENKTPYGKWIKAKVPLWEKGNCEKEEVCIDGKYSPLQDDSGNQKSDEGYFAETHLTATPIGPPTPVVLGEETSSDSENQGSQSQSADSNVDWVDLESGNQPDETSRSSETSQSSRKNRRKKQS